MVFHRCWVLLKKPEKYAIGIRLASAPGLLGVSSWCRMPEWLCLDVLVNNLNGLLGLGYCNMCILPVLI